MAAINALSLLLPLLYSSSFLLAAPNSDLKEKEPRPLLTFTWSNNHSNFTAGDLAVIDVKPSNHEKLNISSFNPILTVNRKSGNSCYISGVVFEFEENSPWKIIFTPIRSGSFQLRISEDKSGTQDATLQFEVDPGPVYPSVCFVSWRGLVNEFSAGSKAAVSILPKDAFGNNVTTAAEPLESYNFTVNILLGNGSGAAVSNIVHMGRNELGLIVIEFVLTMAGNFYLQVLGQGSNLDGSPLRFVVNPGSVEISNCEAKPKLETNAWQIYSKVEIYVHQQDPYGNLVQGLYVFDADVIEVETNLSIPISDMYFEEVAPGIQLLSFHAVESGNFLLDIFGESDRTSISKMPYTYAVFAGFCNGSTSIVNGTGLNMSRAGESTEFSVYLNDDLGYPSAVEVERVQVQILRKIDSLIVQPTISPLQVFGGNSSSKIWGSSFRVNYTPEKSGLYEINVQSGNVLLNDGLPSQKQVIAGEVNVSLSSIVKFDLKVPQQIENEVVVRLLDSHFNPVFSQQHRLKLEVVSLNDSSSTISKFQHNNDGSYTSHYVVNNVGNYALCALFDDQRFSSCPFPVNAYNGGYFPKASDDIFTVLEDESIGFDALENDFFAGSNAEIIAYTQPGYGSVLQCGRVLRYTPYRDFHGIDFFTYTMSDVNGNHDTCSITVHILKKPPEFLNFPVQLHATEDIISPKFGGYSVLSITSSDPAENITASLSARYGTVSLSLMVMSFGQPELSITKENKDLVLWGRVEAVNSAMHSFQYLGKENFSGEDTIRVYIENVNGKNVLDISVSVEPVNDPPFISVPEFILLSFGEHKSLLFDKKRDKFNFFVGDPDLHHFPGGDGNFVVAFSVEVNDGFLMTALPSKLINTTELKLWNVYRWQPLQSYVSISRHFMVKAVGIRFHGTIKDCNSVLQELYYQGGDHGAMLTLTVNDLGNYGCFPDCTEKSSLPLYTEATVNLIRRSPMSSFLANSLGSAIIVELILVLFLGAILLFFICKCAVLLMKERRRGKSRISEKQTRPSITRSPENQTDFTGVSLHGGLNWKLRQRSKVAAFQKRTGDNITASSNAYWSHDEAHCSEIAPFFIEKDGNTV